MKGTNGERRENWCNKGMRYRLLQARNHAKIFAPDKTWTDGFISK